MSELIQAIPAQWRTAKLIDVASFQNGHAFYKDGYSNEGLIAIDLYNVDEEGKLRLGDRDKRVSPELCERYTKFKLNRNDLVIVMTDMTQRLGILGKCIIVDQSDRYILNQRMGRIKADESIVLTPYLYYFINSEYFLKPLRSVAKGAVQKYVNTDDIKENIIILPPKLAQKRIAEILSAYDELIENNQRRIKILESMARALYREWFVNFRFPGHENVPRVASPLGEIPQEWEIGRLEDILVLQRGFDLPKSDRVEGSIPIFAATGVTGFHNEAKVKAPGVVTGRSGTIGDVLYIQEDFWPLNTTLWAKAFPKSEPLYAYYLLSSIELKKFNSGAAVPTLNRNDIHGLNVVIPPRGLQQKFQEIAGGIVLQSRKLELKNQNLRRTRDLLLPRLLSGQIKVSVDEEKSAPVTSVPISKSKKAAPRTTDEFVEAVVISQIVRKFSDNGRRIVGRMRYNKLAYLAHRKAEDDVTKRYLKKAAGPYSPWAKYAGPEAIAKRNGYIKEATIDGFRGFVPAQNIEQIDKYLPNYPINAAIEWAHRNLLKKTEELELLATVDFAAVDLNEKGTAITVQNIKQVIQENPEWAPKLERAVFSDSNIQRALNELHKLYPGFYSNSME